MSYSAIRTALAARLNAVAAVGRAHSYVRYSRQPWTDAEFQALFVESSRLNAWQITRVAMTDEQAPESSLVIRRHQIEIYAMISVSDATASEHVHQDALEAVADDWRTGDRTLGGAAHTSSLMDIQQIERVMFSENILAHSATIRLQIEEVL